MVVRWRLANVVVLVVAAVVVVLVGKWEGGEAWVDGLGWG